jgi:hypothetical protein
LSLVQTKQDKAMLKTTTIETPRVSSKKRSAEALGIYERTLDRMIAAGMLKSIKVSMRRRVITNTEIARIVGAERWTAPKNPPNCPWTIRNASSAF